LTTIFQARLTFVHHVGVARLDLCFEDGEPQVLCLDDLARTALALVLFVQLDKLVADRVVQAGALCGAKEGPLEVLLDADHEQVGDPQAQEQVAGTHLLHARVLAQVEEAKDVGVPRLEVDGERTWSAKETISIPQRK